MWKTGSLPFLPGALQVISILDQQLLERERASMYYDTMVTFRNGWELTVWKYYINLVFRLLLKLSDLCHQLPVFYINRGRGEIKHVLRFMHALNSFLLLTICSRSQGPPLSKNSLVTSKDGRDSA